MNREPCLPPLDQRTPFRKTTSRLCHWQKSIAWHPRNSDCCAIPRAQQKPVESTHKCLPHTDIAFDCIADLFQQNEEGRFVQLEAYFSSFDIANESDESLLSHLRRLVFSKANQVIFRIYNETDPSLGKIIRNIKLAIQSLNNFDIVTRFDETCILPSACETLEHLPAIKRNEFENQIRNTAHGTETIPQLLAQLSLYLRQQTEYSRLVPMVSVALVFRSLYQNQKVSADEFENYFSVIKESISARLISQDGEDFSFFKGLNAHIPDLTDEEYHKKHKSKIEYLGRLAYDRAIALLKKHST